MNVNIKEKIIELKEKMNAIILAHNYQVPEVQEIADFVGDSLELARKAVNVDAKYIVFAGVDFMAETAAILNPDKTVLLPSRAATCEMAKYLTSEKIRKYRELYPDAAVVLYVNSTAEAKAEADITCTSANAVKVVKSLSAKTILFGPDANLASYVAENVPDKEIIPLPSEGHCYVHTSFDPEWIPKDGFIMVHPECPPEIRKIGNIIASTGGMIKFVKNSTETKFVVVTEKDMISRLKRDFPDREFIAAYENAICLGMKNITLEKILYSLENKKHRVVVEEKIAEKARKAILRMLEVS